MTTETRIITTDDVFTENEVYLLSKHQHPNVSSLGGVGWLRREPPRNAHLTAMHLAALALGRARPDYRLLLLGSHTAAQPSTAATRHRRFWNSLKFRGFKIPSQILIDDFAGQDSDPVRWRGAALIRDDELDCAVTIIEEEPASSLIAGPDSLIRRIDEIIKNGWAWLRRGPPAEVLEWAWALEGVVFFPVGGFDDPESGVVSFSSAQLTHQLHICSFA
jgi:hypothetical protein